LVGYENELPGLGSRFKFAVLGQVQRIVNNPEFYPVKNRNFRESNVKVFPYVIVYKINYSKQKIYIYRKFIIQRETQNKNIVIK